MRKKVTGTLVVTLLTALYAVARRLGTADVDEDSDDSDGPLTDIEDADARDMADGIEDGTENTEKRGLKWGPIMPWWPRR